MTDWSGLEAEARKRTRECGPRCAVEVFLSHQDDYIRRQVTAAIENPNLTTVGIHRAVSALTGHAPYAPSVWSIGNHRRGNCRCNKP